MQRPQAWPGERVRPRLEALEDRTLLSYYMVNLAGDVGSGSGLLGDIRYCINQANSDPGSTITFDNSLAGNTIHLTHGELTISANMTITGLGPTNLTVSGANSSRVFDIPSTTAQVTISGLTISGGIASDGGGIYNVGNLTVSDTLLAGNSTNGVHGQGGGIYNSGSLTISDSTISRNLATDYIGGGISNDVNGILTVNDSSLTGNDSAVDGGAISNLGSMTISGSALAGNSAVYDGGGISNGGNMTVIGSTLSNNSATATYSHAGGIYNSGTLTISESTLSGNSAFDGGAIYSIGSLAISDSTLFSNSAGGTQVQGAAPAVGLPVPTAEGGGIWNAGTLTISNGTLSGNNSATSGGGLYVVNPATLHNTLIAGNFSGSTPSDVFGSLDPGSDYNVIGIGGSGGLMNSNGNQVGVSDPGLAPLGNYSGPTQTMALLPGSPAIDKGNSAYGEPTDQRGVAHVGPPDIGAFESRGFTMTIAAGNGQSAAVNNSFAQPLVVSVSSPFGEPVAGGHITFTVPASGASATLRGNPAIIGSDGKASVTAVANGVVGSYTITAAASGIAASADFTLSNLAFPHQVLMQTVVDVQVLPEWNTSEATATLEGIFGTAFAMAAMQSPQRTMDLVWQELRLTWDLMLAGGNPMLLVNNPHAIALANAIDQNPLYHTLAGWIMANAEMERLLIG